MCTKHKWSRLSLALATALAAASLMASSCAGMLGGGGDPPEGTGVNKAPVIVGNTISTNITAPTTGQTVRLSVTANDPEGKPLTVTWRDGNEISGQFDGDGTAVFWSTDKAGTYFISVTVYDDQMLSATASLTLVVTDPVVPPPDPDNNIPPAFGEEGIKGDVTAPVVGQKIIFSVAASDPDGDPVEVIWTDSTGQDNFNNEVMADGVATVEWKAPSPGAFIVTATANDGHVSSKVSSAITTLDTSVSVAALPATFKYMGAAYCGSCHPSAKSQWEGTAHATMETRFQETKYARRESCRQCHTLGYQDQGYIAFDVTPQFANIQCESCHGSGVGHPANGPLPAHFADPAESCGKCHTGARYGTFDEWQQSGHATLEATIEEATNRSCVRCHNGEWFVRIQINGEEAPAENLPEGTATSHTCATCHDPHNAQFASQLRVDSSGPVVIPMGDVPVEGGKGNICLKCHNGRRTQTDMNNALSGNSPRGMHANAQGPMLFGLAGFDIPGFTYDKSHPHNTWNNNSCVTCHMWTKGYESAESPAVFGHTFNARLEACLTCHQGQTMEGMEALKNNFQAEITALMHEFEELWPAEWKTANEDGSFTIRNAPDTQDPPRWNGPPKGDPVGDQYRQAWWNWYFVEEDLSHGIHNPVYAKQLLESAIAKIQELNAQNP